MNFTSDFAESFRSLFVQILVRELEVTAGVIAAIPDNKRDYRPDDRSRSAWDLAWHIASDVWFLEGIAEYQFEPNPESRHRNPTNTPHELAQWYSNRAQSAIERIAQIPSEKLLEPLAIGAVAMQSATAFPIFLYLLFAHNHIVHHRGQLSAYLRAMGGKVPSIYGPTADSA